MLGAKTSPVRKIDQGGRQDVGAGERLTVDPTDQSRNGHPIGNPRPDDNKSEKPRFSGSRHDLLGRDSKHSLTRREKVVKVFLILHVGWDGDVSASICAMF